MNFILPNEQNKYPRHRNVNNLFCLSVVEGFVVGAAGVEFGVCAEVDYVALLEDDNFLHVADCAESVRDYEHCAVVHKFVYRFLDKRLAVDIEGGSGFVQDNQRRVFQEYARDCSSGFRGRWVQDVLRHTYASFHAKNYADLPRLQLNMGHRDLSLLHSRYINMHGISRADAKRFFEPKNVK